MPRSRRLKLYGFVADLVDASEEVLGAELGLPKDRARELGLGVARVFCSRNAKSEVYIPEAANLANLERNTTIWAAFQTNGPPPKCARKFSAERVRELATQYDLSMQQVYNIIRGERMSELALLQQQLPGVD